MSNIRIINGGEEIAITKDELDAILKARKPQLPDEAERWFEWTQERSHIYYSKGARKIYVLSPFGEPQLCYSYPHTPNLRLKPDLQAKVDREAKRQGYESGFVKAFREPVAGETIINSHGLVFCHYLATIETPRPIIGFAVEVWKEPSSRNWSTVYPSGGAGVTNDRDLSNYDLRLTFQPGTEFQTLDDGSLQVIVPAGQPIRQRVRKVGE